MAVSYTDRGNGKGCGVVLYKIASDGSLDGKSGYWGVNSAERETATRISGSDLEGKYKVLGKNTDGQGYEGSLDIKEDGEGYSFKWNAGSHSKVLGSDREIRSPSDSGANNVPLSATI